MSESEKEKPEKAKKAPGFYRKRISAERLEKKYLKYIDVSVDRRFIAGCYEERDDGLHIRTDLKEGDIKRLKILAAAIKNSFLWVSVI